MSIEDSAALGVVFSNMTDKSPNASFRTARFVQERLERPSVHCATCLTPPILRRPGRDHALRACRTSARGEAPESWRSPAEVLDGPERSLS